MGTGHFAEGPRRARDYYAGTHRRTAQPGAHRRRGKNPLDGSDSTLVDRSRGRPSRGSLAGVLAATLVVGGAVAVPQLPKSGANTDADGVGGGLSPAPGPAASGAGSLAAAGDGSATDPGAATSQPSDDGSGGGLPLAAAEPAGSGAAATDDCSRVTVDEASLTVRAVDHNDEVPGYDTLSVTGRVNGDPTNLTAFVALWDPDGLPVTMARTALPFGTSASSASPAEWTLARLDGAAIGDAGASGVFTVEIVLRTDALGCPFSPPVRVSSPQLNASEFVGWPVTADRLRQRLEAYLAAGAVSGPFADLLRAALSRVATASGVQSFLDLVDSAATQGDLSPEASNRLRSLAERLRASQARGPEGGAAALPVDSGGSAAADTATAAGTGTAL